MPRTGWRLVLSARTGRAVAATAVAAALVLGLVLALHGLATVRAAPAAATVHYVDDDPGCDGQTPCYGALQDAVDAAAGGDEVRVAPGRYTETVHVVDKALRIIGPGHGDPSAPGDPERHALLVGRGGGDGAARAAALTVEARLTDVVGARLEGLRVLSAPIGVLWLGREPGDPVPLPPGHTPSITRTRVVDAVVAECLFAGIGPPADGQRRAAVLGYWTRDVTVRDSVVRDAPAGAVLLVGNGARIYSSTLDKLDGPGVHAERVSGTLSVAGITVTRAAVGLRLIDVVDARVERSTIVDNATGVRVVETELRPDGAPGVVLGGAPSQGNRLGASGGPALVLENATGGGGAGSDVRATYNHWGTAYAPVIEEQVVHAPDDPVLGRVHYLPALGAPSGVTAYADPPRVPADGVSEAEITALVRDAAGRPAADGALVLFDTSRGVLAQPGRRAEAEALAREGEWGLFDSPRFGPFSGQGYLRSGVAGARLMWTFSAPAVVLRYGQATRDEGGGVFDVALDGQSLGSVATVGPERTWVERLLADGLDRGLHTLTVTVRGGEVNVDSLLAGVPVRGGAAVTQLRAGEQVAVAQVRAEARGAAGPQADLVEVPLVPGPPDAVTLTLGAPALPVGGMTTTVRAWVGDARRRPVADGTEVRFDTSLGEVGPAVVRTADGWARTTLTTGMTTGLATVGATAGSVRATADVTVTAGGPAELTVSAARATLPANSHASTALEMTVRDRFGHPVRDGTLVALTTTLGTLDVLTATTRDGTAAGRLRAGAEAGPARVTARVGELEAGAVVALVPLELGVTKTVEPQSVVVPGETVTFTVHYVNEGPGAVYGAEIDDPLPAGLTAPLLDVSGPPLEQIGERPPLAWRVARLDPGVGGVITLSLRVDPDRRWPERSTLDNQVTIGSPTAAEATPDDNRAQAEVVVVPAAVYTVTVRAPEALVVGGATGEVTARVTDREGRPATDGTTVTFRTDLGSVAPVTATTRGGVARATLTSGTRAGQATVRARTFEGRGGSAVVRFEPGPATRLGLASERSWLAAGGETTVLTATLADQYANGIAGEPVAFETDLGRVEPAVARTGGRGWATTTLRSGVRAGMARVVARGGFLTEAVTVPVRPGPAALLSLVLSPSRVPLGGAVRAVGRVRDDFGNPVPGVQVTFAATHGVPRDETVRSDGAGEAVTEIRTTRPGVGVARVTAGTLMASAPLVVERVRLHLPMVVKP